MTPEPSVGVAGRMELPSTEVEEGWAGPSECGAIVHVASGV